MRKFLPPVVLAGCILSACAAAQEFPVRQIRIIVPFPAGDSFDIMSRVLAQRMQLGQSVLVENRPGGGTVIGTEYVARQPADGHTLLCIGPTPEVRENMRGQCLNAAPGTPEQFSALLKSDGDRYTRVARAANIRLD